MTKTARHRIYKRALIALEEVTFLCVALADEGVGSVSLKDFPEIIKHKPTILNSTNTWFGADEEGRAKRQAILRQAIRDSAPLKKKKQNLKRPN